MLTPEQSFFLQVLADHAAQRASRPPEGLDWERLVRLAVNQQVHTILWYQCKDYLAGQPTLSAVSQQLQRAYDGSCYAYIKRNMRERELKQAFSAASIPVLTVKGAVTAASYPVPELRTMGDTDMVVSPEDRPRAHKIMLSLGYQNTRHGDREWVYVREGMEFELHSGLLYTNAVNTPELVSYFNHYAPHVISGDGEDALTPEFHFMYQLVHLRKHFLAKGMGFRPFYDLALAAKNTPSMDWAWVTAELEKLGLGDFFRCCMGFCSAWFAVELPMAYARPEPAFYCTATEQIFANGLLGFGNPDNRANYVSNAARQGKGRVSAFFGRFFPPYRALLEMGRYEFLRGRPVLLPVAWGIYQVREISRSHLRQLPTFIAGFFTPRSRVAQRDEYLKKWGL